MPLTSHRHCVFAPLAAIALLLLVAAPVTAHAELETATPGPDQTVEGSPAELVATFTEPLDAETTSIVVLDPVGATVASGGEPGATPEQWRLPLPDLEPGAYEVRWTASSTVDSHLERGTYAFTVTAAPTPSPTPAPTPTPEPSASEEPTPAPTTTPSASPSAPPSASAAPAPATDPAAGSSVLIPIVAVLLLVAALGARLLRRRGP